MARAPIIISNGGIVGVLEEYMKEGLSLGKAFKKLYKETDTYTTAIYSGEKCFTYWHLKGDTDNKCNEDNLFDAIKDKIKSEE